MIKLRNLRLYIKFKYFIKETDRLLDRMGDHHLFILAAGIAFNILLYTIPLFLLAVFLTSLFVNIEDMAYSLSDILIELLPNTSSAHELANTVVREITIISNHSSLVGWIGIAILLWLSSTLFSSIRTGLNAVYEIKTPRIFIIYRFKDIFLTSILTFLILIVMYVVPFFDFLLASFSKLLPELIAPIFSGFTIRIVSLCSSFVLFYFLFKFVPNKKLPRYPRVVSTLLSVTFIELSKEVFSWYLGNFSSYGKFYGTYAVIVSMAIWIYYFSLIILASAETGQFLYEKRMKKRAGSRNIAD